MKMLKTPHKDVVFIKEENYEKCGGIYVSGKIRPFLNPLATAAPRELTCNFS